MTPQYNNDLYCIMYYVYFLLTKLRVLGTLGEQVSSF